MSDGVLLTMNSNGELEKYDDTYDLIIHCKSEEEHDKAVKLLTGRRWIPMSAHLPERGEDVLVSFGDEDCVIAYRTIHSDNRICWINSSTGREIFLKIVAWMPLPEPYRASAENAQTEETPLTEQPQTNADWIRNMTDDELAEFLFDFKNDFVKPSAEETYEEWLKAPSAVDISEEGLQ